MTQPKPDTTNALAPLVICDRFEDFPEKSQTVYIVSGDNKWIIAKDVFRPVACMLVNAFNEKYGATDAEA